MCFDASDREETSVWLLVVGVFLSFLSNQQEVTNKAELFNKAYIYRATLLNLLYLELTHFSI